MKAVFITLTVLACMFGATLVEGSLCNTISTARIIAKLCYVGNNSQNQTLIDGFFGCYDKAPGKEQFVACQTTAFGGPMDNVQAVSTTCKSPQKIPAYGSCLKDEFEKAGIDMDATVKTINECQSEVMQIGSSWIPKCRN